MCVQEGQDKNHGGAATGQKWVREAQKDHGGSVLRVVYFEWRKVSNSQHGGHME